MIFKTKDAFTFATFSAQNVCDNSFTCPEAGTVNVFQAYFMIIPTVACTLNSITTVIYDHDMFRESPIVIVMSEAPNCGTTFTMFKYRPLITLSETTQIELILLTGVNTMAKIALS
jgi:hypothetical protein